MAAGVPVVMFDGVLESQMKISAGMEDLLRSLNILLFFGESRAITFTIGELDLATRVFRAVNGGCLGPYHYQAKTGEFAKLQLSAMFPRSLIDS